MYRYLRLIGIYCIDKKVQMYRYLRLIGVYCIDKKVQMYRYLRLTGIYCIDKNVQMYRYLRLNKNFFQELLKTAVLKILLINKGEYLEKYIDIK